MYNHPELRFFFPETGKTVGGRASLFLVSIFMYYVFSLFFFGKSIFIVFISIEQHDFFREITRIFFI